MTEVQTLRSRTRAPRPQVRDRIFTATIDLLHEVTYGSLTIEAVAARAGASKATIYRWWPSKAVLVTEACATVIEFPESEPTGSLRGDLVAAVRGSVELTARSPLGLALGAVAFDLSDDPAAASVYRSHFIEPQLSAVRQIVERATENGELPRGADPELLLDAYAGTVLYRTAVSGRSLNGDFAERFVDLVLGAVAAAR